MRKKDLSIFYLKYRFYVFPIIVILSCFILIVFIIYPQIINLISNARLEKQLKERQGVLEAKAQVLESINEQDLSIKVNSVLTAYPAEKDFASVVGLLQQLASQSGFSLTTLSLGHSSSAKYAGSQSYNVKLEILGPKSLLTGFIDSIEESPRIMRVGTLELTTTRDTNVVNSILEIEVLFASLPATFGTVDSPLPQLTTKDEELIAKLAASALSQAPTQPVTLGPRGKTNPFE